MKYSFIVLLFLLSFGSYAQGKKIIIIDSLNKEPLSYASLISLSRKTGYYADKDGAVFIPNISDSLKIEYSGYFSKTIFITKNIDSIYLVRKVNQLPDVIIKKLNRERKVGTFKYNMRALCGAYFSFKEVSKVVLKNQDKRYKINKVFIPIGDRNVEIDSPILKLHLYTVNKISGLPEEDILEKPVFISWQNIKEKNYYIDISQQNIISSEPELFVGIECVFDKGSATHKQGKKFTLIRRSPLTLFAKNHKDHIRKQPLGNESFLMNLETSNGFSWLLSNCKFAAGLIISE